MVIKRVVPNFCINCHKPIPDQLKYRMVKVKDSSLFSDSTEVRIAVCGGCGADLRFVDREVID